MLMLKQLRRWWRCKSRRCPGKVVSGWRDGQLMVGWRCVDCGQVKYYGRIDDGA